MNDREAAAKRRWRRRLRRLWQACEPAELERLAAAALEHLQALAEWQRAATVFTYINLAHEFPTRGLIEAAWADGKRVGAPVVHPGGVMEAHVLASWDELARGAFGIPAPDTERCPRLPPEEIDLCIVPGFAFDRRGVRLGRGGGYYDRYLPRLRRDAVRAGWIAAAFLVDELPLEPHDARVDVILTETGLWRCGRAV